MAENTDKMRYYVHKFEVQQSYGGPEEGGWWYKTGVPTDPGTPVFSTNIEEAAYAACRELNRKEQERRERENEYGYTSVLSYRDTFYEYDISEDKVAEPFPKERPHYE